MTQEHPITPPTKLVQQWLREEYEHGLTAEHVATQAARWGADQQLEECERYWMTHGISPEGVVRMREHLRPKPPSLKEQALQALEEVDDTFDINEVHHETIRRALEQLDD
jgi:hypothetical protein